MIRIATIAEIDLLNRLITHSARELSKGFYTPAEIDGAIEYIFGVDTELLEDKTYYVIEHVNTIVACGGWSRRKTLFGGDQCDIREVGYLDPKVDAAKIRAFFVHPDFARQGFGSAMLRHCEQEAIAAGFTQLEMMATLPGVPLYTAMGYTVSENTELLLPNGVALRLAKMAKSVNKN